jgi:AraC-like DNA-binding protein
VEIDHDLIEEIGFHDDIDGPIPVDGRTYITQWSCMRHLVAGAELDRLALDDLFLRVLARVLDTPDRQRSGRSQAELVANVRSVLAERFTERITLEEIAGAVHSSPFHLSRTFHRVMGTTMHDYITQLRLRESLEHVWDGTAPLDRIACDLGFSSHSHFTARFRASFGVKPSDLRKRTVPITRLHGLLEGAI